jgi:hypothetical protein
MKDFREICLCPRAKQYSIYLGERLNTRQVVCTQRVVNGTMNLAHGSLQRLHVCYLSLKNGEFGGLIHISFRAVENRAVYSALDRPESNRDF